MHDDYDARTFADDRSRGRRKPRLYAYGSVRGVITLETLPLMLRLVGRANFLSARAPLDRRPRVTPVKRPAKRAATEGKRGE